MPNRSAVNLECVFALKKNWPVIFAVALDVPLILNWYGIQKVICFAQLNSTSEVRFPFMALNPIVGIFEYFIRYQSSNKPFETEMIMSLILHVPMRKKLLKCYKKVPENLLSVWKNKVLNNFFFISFIVRTHNMAVIQPSFLFSKCNLYLKLPFWLKNDNEKCTRNNIFEIPHNSF